MKKLDEITSVLNKSFKEDFSIISEDMSIPQRTSIISVLESVSCEKIRKISELFSKTCIFFVKKEMSFEERLFLIETLIDINHENIEPIFELITNTKVDGSSLVDKLSSTDLIKLIKGISEDNYLDINSNKIALNLYFHYIHEPNFEVDIDKILKIYSAVKRECYLTQRENINYIKIATNIYPSGFCFIQKGMNADQIFEILKIIKKIDYRYLNRFTDLCMDTYFNDTYSLMNADSSYEEKIEWLKEVGGYVYNQNNFVNFQVKILLNIKNTLGISLKDRLTNDQILIISDRLKKGFEKNSDWSYDMFAYFPYLIFEETNFDDKIQLIREFFEIENRIKDRENMQILDDWIVQKIREKVRNVAGDYRIGLNVHVEDRDTSLSNALNLLRSLQKDANLKSLVDDCINHLKDKNTNSSQVALDVILKPKQKHESFGPLLDNIDFSIEGNKTNGMEILARLWLYIQSIKDPIDKENAIASLIAALNDSINQIKLSDSTTSIERLCNQGKSQRLFVAVLQGRIPGVAIDQEGNIPLSQIVSAFCEKNKDKNKDEFLKEVIRFEEELKPEMRLDFKKEIQTFIDLQFDEEED